MKRHFLALLVLFGCGLFNAIAQTDKSIQHQVGILLADWQMQGAHLSLSVNDAKTGKSIYSFEDHKTRIPASTLKLFTTSCALDILGSDYRFKTPVYFTGVIRDTVLIGDIIIKGVGDPTIASSLLKQDSQLKDIASNIVTELKKQGARSLKVNIRADQSAYSFNPLPTSWIWADIGNYYGASVHAINIYENKLELHFKTGVKGTPAILAATKPEYIKDKYELKYDLISQGLVDSGFVYSAPYGKTIFIEGHIPYNRDPFILKASLPDPGETFLHVLKVELQSHGWCMDSCNVASTFDSIPFLNSKNLLTTIVSPPLYQIVNKTNHISHNMFAEAMLKHLGWIKYGYGSTQNGIKVLNDWISKNGLDSDNFFFDDGSGLSRGNYLTTYMQNQLLTKAYNFKWFNDFYNSLPEFNRANWRLKSGYISKARSYSGYIKAKNGDLLAVSIVVNNFKGSPTEIKNKLIKVLESIDQ